MTENDIPPPTGDRLDRAISALRIGAPVKPGLEQRTRSRTRRGRTRRWASGSFGVAAVAAVTLVLTRHGDPAGQITFALTTPASSGVSLVGDFNEWRTDRVRLAPTGENHWEVTLQLPPGRYRFAYVTDRGEWLPDPNRAPVRDDFGRPTSILTVPQP